MKEAADRTCFPQTMYMLRETEKKKKEKKKVNCKGSKIRWKYTSDSPAPTETR